MMSKRFFPSGCRRRQSLGQVIRVDRVDLGLQSAHVGPELQETLGIRLDQPDLLSLLAQLTPVAPFALLIPVARVDRKRPEIRLDPLDQHFLQRQVGPGPLLDLALHLKKKINESMYKINIEHFF